MSSACVLIVEDSPTQALRLQNTLEKNGFAVTAVGDGSEALDALARCRPALVVSDIQMPKMDGYELCRHVKSDPALREIPLILLTSLSAPQDIIRGLECGADNFVVKPYEDEFLLARIHAVLANNASEQAASETDGMTIEFAGQRYVIEAGRRQILSLLLSTYAAAIVRNKELSAMQSELQERSIELERANGDLESANKELEAFSYSVSHDLRTPLRHIDGFAQLLMNNFAAQFPPPAQRLLEKVCHSAQHLGVLIDDLLRFFRFSRQPLAKVPVNLAQLVERVLGELEGERQGRDVKIQLERLPTCLGDAALLKQVFVNLLTNALKFTRQREQAIIELGCQEQPGEITCSVRDNGAGFDMQFANKLFGVFQRLHRDTEFEGTGVGLSIVQRIIHRHGGRIWAEGEVGKGACFYFTLPSANGREHGGHGAS